MFAVTTLWNVAPRSAICCGFESNPDEVWRSLALLLPTVSALPAVSAWATDSPGALLSISLLAIFFALLLLTPLFDTGAASAAPLSAATSATIATTSAGDGLNRG